MLWRFICTLTSVLRASSSTSSIFTPSFARPFWSFPPSLSFTTIAMDHQAHHHNRPASQPPQSKAALNPMPDEDKSADNENKENAKLLLSLQESIDLIPFLKQQRNLVTLDFDHHLPGHSSSSSSSSEEPLADKSNSHINKKRKTDDKTENDEVDNEYTKSPLHQGRPTTIIVEGNIGAGKTTFLQIFEQCCARRSGRPPPLVVPEPVNLWRDVGGVNIFQLLANDPKRWSFAFQSYVQLTMHKIHDLKPTHPDSLKVMERSLFSAQHCFVENLRAGGLLSPTEHFILEQWFQEAAPTTPVDLIVYLKSDPEMVAERIRSRGRPEESRLSLEVLHSLNERHEDWLVRGKRGPLPAPVFVIDANTPLEKMVALYENQTEVILSERLPAVLAAAAGSGSVV